jgi:phosphatidylglycerol:prolipoprotein diacylglycerol transferase
MALVLHLATISWQVLDRIHFGSKLAVSPHGMGIAIGYLSGAYIFIYEAGKRRYPEDFSSSIMFWALVGTIVGARLGWVMTHIGGTDGIHTFPDALKIWQGGISLIGGIAGAVVASYIVVRANRGLEVRFVDGLDSAAMPIALGIVMGRIGDLIIGDHLGKPTSWVLAFAYRGGNLSGYDCTSLHGVCTTSLSGGRTQTVTAHGARLLSSTGRLLGHGVGVHQTAFYDFFIAMGLVLLLIWMNSTPRRRGVLISTFGVWYGTGRILTDFLRVENRFLGLTGSQWSSIVVVAVCIVVLVRFALRPAAAASRAAPPMAPDLAGGTKPGT